MNKWVAGRKEEWRRLPKERKRAELIFLIVFIVFVSNYIFGIINKHEWPTLLLLVSVILAFFYKEKVRSKYSG